jgi:hypothetical protein
MWAPIRKVSAANIVLLNEEILQYAIRNGLLDKEIDRKTKLYRCKTVPIGIV